MNPKKQASVVVALAAVLFNAALVTPVRAQAKAALTRDVDRPSAQPVSAFCSAASNMKCILYTVPAGKRLVVETVSYAVEAQNGGIVRNVVFGQDDTRFFLSPGIGPNVYALTPAFTYLDVYSNPGAPSPRKYAATQPLRAYLDENQVFAAVTYVAEAPVTNYQVFTFSGYLVEK
ncbi:hypothetical protein BH11PSE9_BH11PSE9_17170 [soil metagenome]